MRFPLWVLFALACATVAGIAPVEARTTVLFTSACACEGNHGVERWAEKTDPSEPPANTSEIRAITPATIAGWGAAGGGVSRKGRQGLETLWFAVTGRVTKVKTEDDGDLHLLLEDLTTQAHIVVEIPLGDAWCELRKEVFSWSRIGFPLLADRQLKLTRKPIVTVTGKAFYDGGHAGRDNRRNYDSELSVWEIHPVMQLTESESVAIQANAPSPPKSTPPLASTPAAAIVPQEFVVLTQPVTIQIPYGVTTLPPQTKLPVVSRDGTTVRVRYLEQVYPIPATSTEAR